jgi:hypothetical protein
MLLSIGVIQVVIFQGASGYTSSSGRSSRLSLMFFEVRSYFLSLDRPK